MQVHPNYIAKCDFGMKSFFSQQIWEKNLKRCQKRSEYGLKEKLALLWTFFLPKNK